MCCCPSMERQRLRVFYGGYYGKLVAIPLAERGRPANSSAGHYFATQTRAAQSLMRAREHVCRWVPSSTPLIAGNLKPLSLECQAATHLSGALLDTVQFREVAPVLLRARYRPLPEGGAYPCRYRGSGDGVAKEALGTRVTEPSGPSLGGGSEFSPVLHVLCSWCQHL
jgi:hypothetical protein